MHKIILPFFLLYSTSIIASTHTPNFLSGKIDVIHSSFLGGDCLKMRNMVTAGISPESIAGVILESRRLEREAVKGEGYKGFALMPHFDVRGHHIMYETLAERFLFNKDIVESVFLGCKQYEGNHVILLNDSAWLNWRGKENFRIILPIKPEISIPISRFVPSEGGGVDMLKIPFSEHPAPVI